MKELLILAGVALLILSQQEEAQPSPAPQPVQPVQPENDIITNIFSGGGGGGETYIEGDIGAPMEFSTGGYKSFLDRTSEEWLYYSMYGVFPIDIPTMME